MLIKSDSIAGISYVLTSAKNGEILEKTPTDRIMKFKFGIGELLPKFEENIIGLGEGDRFDFVISSEDAYGPVDPYAIFDIPIDTFEVDGQVDHEMLQSGNQIPMTDNQGNKHLGLITHVMDKAVTMNFNHPLAGVDLRFTGEVIEIIEQ